MLSLFYIVGFPKTPFLIFAYTFMRDIGLWFDGRLDTANFPLFGVGLCCIPLSRVGLGSDT